MQAMLGCVGHPLRTLTVRVNTIMGPRRAARLATDQTRLETRPTVPESRRASVPAVCALRHYAEITQKSTAFGACAATRLVYARS